MAEADRLCSKLYDEAHFINLKKLKSAENFYNNNTFTPNIKNKDTPNIQNFYDRLQGWITNKSARTAE